MRGDLRTKFIVPAAVFAAVLLWAVVALAMPPAAPSAAAPKPGSVSQVGQTAETLSGAVGQSDSAAAVKDPQALNLALLAYAAMAGNTPVSDGTLNGNATWVGGADQFTGSAALSFKGHGASRVDLNLGQFQRSEVRNDLSSGLPDGAWIGSDGIAHHFALHNCWTPAAWFSPVSIIASMRGPNVTLSSPNSESLDGMPVDHVRMSLKRGATAAARDRLERISTVDIYLDTASHLPWAVKFNTHADDNALLDIPVEVRFADYRSISGVLIPFRVQRLLQNELNVDITITGAAVNNGLPSSSFAIQ